MAPYIGSKINLISKLDIRYEGTLYTVDAVESTIVLAKVRSFGTEERLAQMFVAPRDEVYDFITFKACDIKDLIVCEPPKASGPMCAGIPYDPAIVSISKNPPPEPKLPSAVQRIGFDKLPSAAQRTSVDNLSSPMQHINFDKLPSAVQRISFDKDYDFEKANEQFQEEINEALNGEAVKAVTKQNDVEEDTENNNTEFYNKSDSFFDNISCDTLEKETGQRVRPDWKRERRNNTETFGLTAVRSLFFQGRGGGGGGGGRYYGGGGARVMGPTGMHNHNSNNNYEHRYNNGNSNYYRYPQPTPNFHHHHQQQQQITPSPRYHRFQYHQQPTAQVGGGGGGGLAGHYRRY